MKRSSSDDLEYSITLAHNSITSSTEDHEYSTFSFAYKTTADENHVSLVQPQYPGVRTSVGAPVDTDKGCLPL